MKYALCIASSTGGGFQKGHIYKVKRIDKEHFKIAWVYFEKDSKGSTTNAWSAKNFIFIPKPHKLVKLFYG